MIHTSALIPGLDIVSMLHSFGPYAILIVCVIIFAETGLLIGFIFPGDTLLLSTGLLAFKGTLGIDIWWIVLAVAFSAFLGGEVGYLIGHRAGPRIFERKESGFFSKKNVDRTNAFFAKYGALAVIVARFVPVVRTFAPIAAGVGHMPYRKYSLYNLTGAVLWGGGVTFAGYLLGNIPPVANFVEKYVDVILIAVVVIALVPTIYHVIRGAIDSRKSPTPAAAEPLVSVPDDAEPQ